MFKEEIISRLRERNLVRNIVFNKINYKWGEKIEIICDKHGSYFQRLDHLFNGIECNKCADIKRASSKTISLDEVIKQAKLIHGNIYDYSKVEYKKSLSKVEIICQQHGSFFISMSNHISGKQRCPICSNISRGEILHKKLTKSAEYYLQKCVDKYGDKYEYDFSNYYNRKSYIKIKCKKHGWFTQQLCEHLRGSECPYCFKTKSKKEVAWLDSLNISFENRNKTLFLKDNSHIIVDGYDPSLNTVYEFYGDFWHGNLNVFKENEINKVTKTTFKQLYDKTLKREAIIKENGFKLVTIWEKDFTNAN